MANEAIQDDVLPLQKLKPMLGRAEESALGCAIALTKDKKEFVLLVDHKMSSKKVRDKLKAEADDKIDKTSIRFGMVFIDKAGDPGTVKFSLNKAAPGGTLPLMVKLIKRAGYQGVVLNEDPSLEKDGPDTAEGETAPGAPAAASGIPEAPPQPPPAPPPPPSAPPPPPAPDAKAILAGLIKRIGPIAAANPDQKESLAMLAREAQTKLVAGEPVKAIFMALKSALDAASANMPAGGHAESPAGLAEAPKPTDGPLVALAKSSTLWRGTRTQMRGKLEKLKSAILEAYADSPEVKAAVQQNFGELDKIFEVLDDRLDAVLDDAIKAKDPNDRLEFIAESRAIIDQYTQVVASDRLIGELDANPFGVDMKFRDTLNKVLPALSGLARTLH